MTAVATTEILLFEDNPADARMVSFLLAPLAETHRVVNVAHLADGLRLLAERPFSIVLLDLMLPDASGVELVRRVIAAAPTVPVVVLSGQSDERIALEAVQEGAQDYLFKGKTDEDLLIRTIRHAIARKEAEARWRRAEERLRVVSRAMEASPAMVAITGRDGAIEYANPRFREVTGYSMAELEGRNPRILKSGKKTPEEYKGLWDTILSGGTWKGEMENRRKDGTHYWAQASIAPILDEEGRITHFVAVEEDITELRQAKEAAEKASQAKSEFLSSMSHELRTPLNAILGFAQIMEANPREPLTPAQEKAVGHIIRGGRHLLDLINEILELARIESGRASLSIEPTRLGPVVEECLSLVQPLGERRGIRIEVRGGVCDATVLADYTRLKQVLLNLLSNAVKYNRDGGRVTLRCGESGPDRRRIEVGDTGPGIPADRLGELFEPFSRLGAEGSAVEGTGIGLSLARKLIELMGGEIGVASEEGKGSLFWIDIPASRDYVSADPAAPTVPGGNAAITRQAKVLYIEDNPANRALMEVVMERLPGVSLLLAPDAARGLAMAAAHHPDLIIMDIGLPDMDGFHALGHLREAPETRDIPAIALSANAMPRDVQKGLDAGFAHYLTKPIDVPRIMTVVAEMLNLESA
jgi:PAS domain S-box-containing protein